MLNLTRTIKSLPLIAVLFTCVVILSSAAIFASEESTPSSEVSSWLAPDLDSVQAKQLAEEVYPKLSESTRAVHDVNDIYLLLYDDIRPALMGVSSSGNYSLPRIAFYEREIYNAIFGNASGSNFFDGLHELLTYYAGGQYYSIADLQGMTWARVGDINSTLNLTNSYLSALISDYNWTNLNWSYSSARETLNGTTVGSGNYDHLYFVGIVPQSIQTPAVLRLFVPWSPSLEYVSLPDLTINSVHIYTDQMYATFTPSDIFSEFTNGGFYLYLFNFNISSPNGVYIIEIETPSVFSYDSNTPLSLYSIQFDTDEYQQMKQAFYQAKSANAQGSMASDVKRLADYLADPDKIAAEQASQQVIDDTLDGFTGNGAAAAKTSDTGSMKNMSSSLQSGLDTGASAGTAASVFTDNRYWGWFTQQNADLINNPYPAPTYQSTRAPGDQIRDAYSHNQSDLEDMLRGSSW